MNRNKLSLPEVTFSSQVLFSVCLRSMYPYGLTALSSSTCTGGGFADLCLQKSELANESHKRNENPADLTFVCKDRAATLESGHLLDQMMYIVYLGKSLH